MSKFRGSIIRHGDDKTYSKGFTLIELLVVVSIIGLLSSIISTNFSSARASARDVRQKSDLRQMAQALELYYEDNQAYPSTGGAWRGDAFTYGGYGYDQSGYIPNLAPTYLARLGANPNVNSTPMASPCIDSYSGYLYRSDGIDYKLLAHCSIDGILESDDPFYDPRRPTWAWQVSSQGGANW